MLLKIPVFQLAIALVALEAFRESCYEPKDNFVDGDRLFPYLEEFTKGTEKFEIFTVDIPASLKKLEIRVDMFIAKVWTMISQ